MDRVVLHDFRVEFHQEFTGDVFNKPRARNNVLAYDFRQNMINLWRGYTYICSKTTEEQLVSKDACVSKEVWKINHFKMKFLS